MKALTAAIGAIAVTLAAVHLGIIAVMTLISRRLSAIRDIAVSGGAAWLRLRSSLRRCSWYSARASQAPSLQE